MSRSLPEHLQLILRLYLSLTKFYVHSIFSDSLFSHFHIKSTHLVFVNKFSENASTFTLVSQGISLKSRNTGNWSGDLILLFKEETNLRL